MKTRNFFIGMFALATLTFVACSNEDTLDEKTGNGNPVVVEGAATWAKFSFKLGKDGNNTRATGDTYEGTAEEQSIKKLFAYIFNEAGNFEAETTGVINAHETVHTAVLKLTSGKKKVYVVANAVDESWITSKTTAAEFETIVLEHCTTAGRIEHKKGLTESIAAVERVGDFNKITGNGNASENGYLMANVLTATEFTLYPGISEAACSKESYEDEADMEKNNHLNISISRAASKLQATYKDADALTLKDNMSNELGKLINPTFAVRNLPIKSYMFLSNRNSGFLTPFYTLTNTNSSFVDFAKYYDEVNEPTLALAMSSATSEIQSTYLPENSNQTPVRGNTTYVLVKGNFAPAANVVIQSIEVTGEASNYTLNITKNSNAYTTTGDIPNFFMVPEWNNQLYSGPATPPEGFNPSAYGSAMILKEYLNRNAKQKWLNSTDEATAIADVVGEAKIYYTCEAVTELDGIYRIAEITKYTEESPSSGSYTRSNEAKIRFLQYFNNGTCYYRVNVEDNMDGKTEANNLFYSVMRNRFYNVNVSKITSIGYPDDEDVTIDPSDPINQKTYMQAHITVAPWTKVDQDTELGM